jgi:hypothetical protein
MNYKRQANQLEAFLTEEFKKNTPLAVLPDKSIVYKKYKIKQNKKGLWALGYLGGDAIDEFRIKTTALLAAKFYDQTNLKRYNEVKVLDIHYWNNSNDALFFKYRCNNAKDLDRRDLFLWRWEQVDNRAKRYKDEITTMFKANF